MSQNTPHAAIQTPALLVRADRKLLAKLDDWIAARVDPLTREEAAREILEAVLTGQKAGKGKRPISGPVDAPMVRAARLMKARHDDDRTTSKLPKTP